MDEKSFDDLSKVLGTAFTRQGVYRFLAGLGAAGISAIIGLELGEAKNKKGKGHSRHAGKKHHKAKADHAQSKGGAGRGVHAQGKGHSGKGKKGKKGKSHRNAASPSTVATCLHSDGTPNCKAACTSVGDGCGGPCEDVCGLGCPIGTDHRQCQCDKYCDPACFTCTEVDCPDATNPRRKCRVAQFICNCECTPNCNGKCGGPDGCGGTCPNTCGDCQKCGNDDTCEPVCGHNGDSCGGEGDCPCCDGFKCCNGTCVEGEKCPEHCEPDKCPKAPVCKKAICEDDECTNVADDNQNGEVCGEAPVCKETVCQDGGCVTKADPKQNGASCGENQCCKDGKCVDCPPETCAGTCSQNKPCPDLEDELCICVETPVCPTPGITPNGSPCTLSTECESCCCVNRGQSQVCASPSPSNPVCQGAEQRSNGAENGTCQSCPPEQVCGEGENRVCCEPDQTCQGGVCTGSCTPKTCLDFPGKCGPQDNGCGGLTSDCTCPEGQTCNANGICSGCTPDCTGKQCGPNGCGGTCGTCPPGRTCNANGLCVGGCIPDCLEKQCGSNGCGGSCGSCPAGQTCNANGICSGCTPNCTGKACGADGCGGDCGICPLPQTCDASGQCVGCIPLTPEQACTGANATCGIVSDGCGGDIDCGACSAGTTCTAGVCLASGGKKKRCKGHGLAGQPCKGKKCKCHGGRRCNNGKCCETVGDGSVHCNADSDCCPGLTCHRKAVDQHKVCMRKSGSQQGIATTPSLAIGAAVTGLLLKGASRLFGSSSTNAEIALDDLAHPASDQQI